MADETVQADEKAGSGQWRMYVIVIACTLAGNIMHGLGWFHFPTGIVLAYTVAFLISYWIPPRPQASYLMWVWRVFLYALSMWLGFIALPVLLSRWIWPALAYALPAFILILATRYLPPLYPPKRPTPLWQWAVFAIVFSLLFGWIGYTGGIK